MYLHPSVCIDKVLKMLDKLKELETEVHQFSMYKNGEKMIEFAPYPYCVGDKRRVNSVSKTFTSTAVGLCYDMGLLKPEDKLISFFPDEITKNADEKIKKLTLHNLLTMTTGVEDVITLLTESDDPVKTFFSHEFKPLTENFWYNNSASFMLSAVVTQLTGVSMFELLSRKLFSELDIKGAIWPSLNGITEGCAGLRVSADDIARVMQVYLGNGMFNGKRILSEEWINMAKKMQVSTAEDTDLEWWKNGYGYQVWLNKGDGYRASGAIGQYGHVFPKLNVVLGVEGIRGKQDPTHDTYYKFCSDFEGESTATVKDLEEYLKNMYLPIAGDVSVFEGFERLYKLDDNDMNFESAELHLDGDTVLCEISDGEYMQTMRFGVGYWAENKIFAHNLRPELYYLTRPRREIVHFDASCRPDGEENLEVLLRFRDCPFRYKMIISANEKIQMKFDVAPEYLTDNALCIVGQEI